MAIVFHVRSRTNCKQNGSKKTQDSIPFNNWQMNLSFLLKSLKFNAFYKKKQEIIEFSVMSVASHYRHLLVIRRSCCVAKENLTGRGS